MKIFSSFLNGNYVEVDAHSAPSGRTVKVLAVYTEPCNLKSETWYLDAMATANHVVLHYLSTGQTLSLEALDVLKDIKAAL